MAGKLSDHPLAELLQEVSILGLSGALRLEHEALKVALYFDKGSVILAAANVKNLRLGEYLRRRQLVTAQELSANGGSRQDVLLANALLDKGILDRHTVETVFATLISDITCLALLWREGTWEYEDRTRLAETLRVSIDTPSLLIEAARKFEPAFVASRFPNPDELISPNTSHTVPAYLMPSEAFVLSRLDQPLSLNEVVMLSGLPENDALRTVYGLIVAGYLKRESFPQVLKQSATTKKPAAPAPLPPPKPAPVVEPEIVLGLTEEQELELFFRRMEEATHHYAVLDVDRSADISEIKRAYYSLARRYHPDRFHSQANLHSKVESAFARITHAYETLTNPKNKSAYDLKLAGQERASKLAEAAPKSKTQTASQSAGGPIDAAAQSAEKNFREGFAALQLGQTAVAIRQLAAAAHAAPKEPRYRAYYGKALAADGRSKRLAEVEMQAAVQLEPSNAGYRLMLAELFFELSFHRRAEAEAQRVIELDPKNAEAQALLKKLSQK